MKEILSEYGRTILAALAFLFIIALAFTVPILGQKGLLAATGSKSEISGRAGTGLSSADAIKKINSVHYEIRQNNTELKTGVKTPINSILTSTDATAVFSVTELPVPPKR